MPSPWVTCQAILLAALPKQGKAPQNFLFVMMETTKISFLEKDAKEAQYVDKIVNPGDVIWVNTWKNVNVLPGNVYELKGLYQTVFHKNPEMEPRFSVFFNSIRDLQLPHSQVMLMVENLNQSKFQVDEETDMVKDGDLEGYLGNNTWKFVYRRICTGEAYLVDGVTSPIVFGFSGQPELQLYWGENSGREYLQMDWFYMGEKVTPYIQGIVFGGINRRKTAENDSNRVVLSGVARIDLAMVVKSIGFKCTYMVAREVIDIWKNDITKPTRRYDITLQNALNLSWFDYDSDSLKKMEEDGVMGFYLVGNWNKEPENLDEILLKKVDYGGPVYVFGVKENCSDVPKDYKNESTKRVRVTEE